MIRGTTPTHTFTLDIDTSTIDSIFITYCQGGRTIFEKTKQDCIFLDDNKTVTVRLLQADTLALSSVYKCKIQIRVKTVNGTAVASDVFERSVDDILRDGEI